VSPPTLRRDREDLQANIAQNARETVVPCVWFTRIVRQIKCGLIDVIYYLELSLITSSGQTMSTKPVSMSGATT
jgi:hypothetical protein